MPPKKKKTGQKAARKAKPAERNVAVAQEDEAPLINGADDAKPQAPAEEASEPAGKMKVRWAKPKTNWIKHAEFRKWAPVLFERPWEELEMDKIDTFAGPQLSSPLHTDATGKKITAPADIGSNNLRSLYDEVQSRSEDCLAGFGDGHGCVFFDKDEFDYLKWDLTGFFKL